MNKDIPPPGGVADAGKVCGPTVGSASDEAATVSERSAPSPAGHTPGPWSYRMAESRMWHVRAPSKAVCFTASSYTKHGTATNEANARLIAAAPELLEATRRCMDWIIDLAESGDAGFWDAEKMDEVIAARAAIAKAEGRS